MKKDFNFVAPKNYEFKFDEYTSLRNLKEIASERRFLTLIKEIKSPADEQIDLCNALLRLEQSEIFTKFLLNHIDYLKKNQSTQKNITKKNPFEQLFVRS